MKKVGLRTREISKLLAFAISFMIVVSSVAIIQVTNSGNTESNSEVFPLGPSFQIRPCELTMNNSLPIPWLHFDSKDPGTPAEVHVTISDTTGITVVADFHGFWRSNYTNGTTTFDDLIMPGASSMREETGAPMLPVLTKLLEIPHDVDISIEILSSSNDTSGGYDIRPVPPLYYPVAVGEDYSPNASTTSLMQSEFLGPIYDQNALFPESIVNTSGEFGAAPLIIRDHRVMQLGFYPVQYNPWTGNITAFSQIVVKVKYSSPAQIQPIRESLRSAMFERILKNSLLYYDECHSAYASEEGAQSAIRYIFDPIHSYPNVTIPHFMTSQLPLGREEGAEYLIITNDTFRIPAQRLADWKQRKGITARVWTLDFDNQVSRERKIENIKGIVEYVYEYWHPVPTYIVLFGDVETIPTNAGMVHDGYSQTGHKLFPDGGQIATDLDYFTVQSDSFFPDIIYSRISVDTVEQAEIVVNRTIMYEQAPNVEDIFYSSILQSGYFQDSPGSRDGVEDYGYPFIYHLESIRHYLQNQYTVHFNYSCAVERQDPIYFRAPLRHPPNEGAEPTNLVADYIDPGYNWLYGYDTAIDRGNAERNISLNINDGRFLAIYFGHGGSKNMKNSFYVNFSTDNRDIVEGWHTPWFNASSFYLLNNANRTPLVLSMACSSGWFDGESDQEYCHLDHTYVLNSAEDAFEREDIEGNYFEMYDGECFAENLTRLAGGGAIAVIAPSRPVIGVMAADVLEGMIQAIWPGYLEPRGQPIYQIGGAFFAARLHAAGEWTIYASDRPVAQEMYESFHLFGDPETQLWTEVPSVFNVTGPESIGSQSGQGFAVTVNDLVAKEPVINAKVCLQQGTDIYQVKYTDGNGQVIFDIDSLDSLRTLNVTVTKHNYIPHIGEIPVDVSKEALVTVDPGVELAGESVTIELTGFNPQIIPEVYFDRELIEDIELDRSEILLQSPDTLRYKLTVPPGSTGYVNVRVEQYGIIATTRFYRLSSDQNPDPYIYCQWDPSTWPSEDTEPVWDNPCINIYENGRLADHLEVNKWYDVNVTVHNRGDGDANRALVTLWYATFGGGVDWYEVGYKTVDIPLFGSTEVSFEWSPDLPDTACLNVTIFHGNELPEDRDNNLGVECWHVFPLCSPGMSEEFEIGNPSEEEDYVSITVRQVGNEDDICSASVEGYDSLSLEPQTSDTVTLIVDSEHDLTQREGRRFTAEMYVNDTLILGIQFDGYCFNPFAYVIIILIVLFIALVLIAFAVNYSRRDRFIEILIILALVMVVILEILLLLEWLNIIDYVSYIGGS